MPEDAEHAQGRRVQQAMPCGQQGGQQQHKHHQQQLQVDALEAAAAPFGNSEARCARLHGGRGHARSERAHACCCAGRVAVWWVLGSCHGGEARPHIGGCPWLCAVGTRCTKKCLEGRELARCKSIRACLRACVRACMRACAPNILALCAQSAGRHQHVKHALLIVFPTQSSRALLVGVPLFSLETTHPPTPTPTLQPDLIADQKGLPREKVKSWTPYAGGAACNVATSIGKLSMDVVFITALVGVIECSRSIRQSSSSSSKA